MSKVQSTLGVLVDASVIPVEESVGSREPIVRRLDSTQGRGAFVESDHDEARDRCFCGPSSRSAVLLGLFDTAGGYRRRGYLSAIE